MIEQKLAHTMTRKVIPPIIAKKAVSFADSVAVELFTGMSVVNVSPKRKVVLQCVDNQGFV